MKSKLLVLLAGLLLLGSAAPARQAQAAVSVGVSIFSGGPHRGLSLSFSSRPEFVVIPGSRVYYGRDIDRDVYCYGDDWYYVDDGAWYRGSSYRGPFIQVSFTSVPYEVRGIPVRYRRHWSDRYSGRTTYQRYGYGGAYGNRSGYGSGSYGNNRGYSGRNSTWNQNNNQQRDWNQNNQQRDWNQNQHQQRDWTQNNQPDRGSWSDRNDRQNQGDNGHQNNGNGHGRKRGHNRDDNRGNGRNQ